MAQIPLFSHLVHAGAVVLHLFGFRVRPSFARWCPERSLPGSAQFLNRTRNPRPTLALLASLVMLNGVTGAVLDRTTVVRAAAAAAHNLPSVVNTHTFIFPNSVLEQPANPVGYPAHWITGGGVSVPADYAMDPRITGDPAYRERAHAAFHTLPTLVSATEAENLFSRQIGIYATPEGSGLAWERPASAAWIFPDGRIPDATGSWHLCATTPGTPNQAVTLAPPTSLVLNEWQPDPETADVPWIELHDRDLTLPAALRGLYLAIDDMVGELHALSFLPPGGFLRLFRDQQVGPDHLDLPLPLLGAHIVLYTHSAIPLDAISCGHLDSGASEGRLPDGSPDIRIFPFTDTGHVLSFTETNPLVGHCHFYRILSVN